MWVLTGTYVWPCIQARLPKRQWEVGAVVTWSFGIIEKCGNMSVYQHPSSSPPKKKNSPSPKKKLHKMIDAPERAHDLPNNFRKTQKVKQKRIVANISEGQMLNKYFRQLITSLVRGPTKAKHDVLS